MNDLDEFSQDYLRQWNERATVRGRSRYRMSAADLRHDLFPVVMQPLEHHPAITALGKAARHELLVRSALGFQGDVATAEVDVVADLCAQLANRPVSFALPEATRQVALTVATDEAYHSYLAREFVMDVERLTGMTWSPPKDRDQPIVKALARIRQEAPAGLLHEAEIMVLCFAENFIVEELFGMSKDVEVDDPFRIVVREHLIDEGRHQVFFQRVMRHMWAALDEQARTALGRMLPAFLDASLMEYGYYTQGFIDTLGFLGFDREQGAKMVMESFSEEHAKWDGRKSSLKIAARSLNLVQVAGFLDHAPTRAALVEGGWVTA